MKFYKEQLIIIIAVVLLIIGVFVYNKYTYKANIGVTVDGNVPNITYDVKEKITS